MSATARTRTAAPRRDRAVLSPERGSVANLWDEVPCRRRSWGAKRFRRNPEDHPYLGFRLSRLLQTPDVVLCPLLRTGNVGEGGGSVPTGFVYASSARSLADGDVADVNQEAVAVISMAYPEIRILAETPSVGAREQQKPKWTQNSL